MVLNKVDRLKFSVATTDIMGIAIIGMLLFHVLYNDLLGENLDVCFDLLGKAPVMYILTPLFIFGNWGNFFSTLCGFQCTMSMWKNIDNQKKTWVYLLRRIVFAFILTMTSGVVLNILSQHYLEKGYIYIPEKVLSFTYYNTFYSVAIVGVLGPFFANLIYLLLVHGFKIRDPFKFCYIGWAILFVILFIYTYFYRDIKEASMIYAKEDNTNPLYKNGFFILTYFFAHFTNHQFSISATIIYSLHAAMLGLLYTTHSPKQYKKLFITGAVLVIIFILVGLPLFFTKDNQYEEGILDKMVDVNGTPGYIFISLGLQTLVVISYGFGVDNYSSKKALLRSYRNTRRSRIFRVTATFSLTLYYIDYGMGFYRFLMHFFQAAYNGKEIFDPATNTMIWNPYVILFFTLLYTFLLVAYSYFIAYITDGKFSMETVIGKIASLFGAKFRSEGVIFRITQPEMNLKKMCEEVGVIISDKSCCGCGPCIRRSERRIASRRQRLAVYYDSDVENSASTTDVPLVVECVKPDGGDSNNMSNNDIGNKGNKIQKKEAVINSAFVSDNLI